ncbi:MAG: CHASE2 domain-containing protein [Treponema sp.]|nr:CHASE2 domain-containing protein [Treponema sp.]
MKRKTLFANAMITLLVSLFIVLLCGSNVTEKLEFRLYDGLIHLTKDPEMSDDILMVIIDDIDIDQLGDWPWSRDILADTLIRMKELGAAAAIFDIEYINTAPKSVASNAEEKINSQIYQTQDLTEQLIQAIPQALNGGTPKDEIASFANSLIDEYLIPSYSDLYDYVSNNVSFDNDEYFGRAIQFFGNTWLTVNNQDLGYSSITKEDVNYIRNRMLTYRIDDEKDNIQKDNKYTFENTYDGVGMGFTPALHSLVKRSHGVGFTNSNVDPDGVRRRNELFYEYDGKYLGQLVFAPLMSILDAHEFTRTKNALIIHDALYPGTKERQTVKIPLDNHGEMLINWQHESNQMDKSNLYGINYANVYYIKNLDNSEKNIISILNLLSSDSDFILFDEDGYAMEYVGHAAELVDFYNEIAGYKEYLLSLCTGYDVNSQPLDGIIQEDYDNYFAYRKNFFEEVKTFCEAGYFNQIKESGIAAYYDEQHLNALEDAFNTIETDISEYLTTFDELSKKFNNKYCILGQTAASTTDIGAIPFVKQYPNVGIHANLMNTILEKDFITYYPWYFGFAVTLILSIILLFFSDKSSSFQNLVGGISRFIIIVFFIVLFVFFHIYIPMLTSVIMFTLIDFLVGVIYRYLLSSREKKFITAVASSFANKDTVEQLRKNPELFKTEGEKKYITALFSDIQKFSTFSETITKMHPEDGANRLIALLNEYLGAMSNEILKNNGNIDKYEGDAIISMFGAPDPMNLHGPEGWAYASLDSAIRMKKCEVEFNATHQELFEPMEIVLPSGEKQVLKLNPFQTRIGLNSGYANVGLMGSKTETFSKLNYTMIGDTVNLASRLEGVNKPYKSWIMTSDETWNKANSGANEGKIVARKLDQVRVVGRKTPVQLYNIIGFRDEMKPEEIESIEIFNAAYEKYILKDFVNAGKMFMQASSIVGTDDTALVLANRCKDYIENGIPENWDGILNMTEK